MKTETEKNWCTNINYAFLTDNNKLYTGPILKIYKLMFCRSLSIFCIFFSLPFVEL